MNDRYLYRGLCKESFKLGKKYWVEGGIHFSHGKPYIMVNDLFSRIEVIPETLRQCTGQKDSNDNLIFEGDIVKWGKIGIGTVVWLGFSWLIMHSCGDNNYVTFSSNGINIIGNIHDNPELLEVIY